MLFVKLQKPMTDDQIYDLACENDPNLFKGAGPNLTPSQINKILSPPSFIKRNDHSCHEALIQSFSIDQLITAWTSNENQRNPWLNPSRKLFSYLSNSQKNELVVKKNDFNLAVKTTLSKPQHCLLFKNIAEMGLLETLLDLSLFTIPGEIAALGYLLPNEQSTYLFQAYQKENVSRPEQIIALMGCFRHPSFLEIELNNYFPSFERNKIESIKFSDKKSLLNWPKTNENKATILKIYQELDWKKTEQKNYSAQGLKVICAGLLLQVSGESETVLDNSTIHNPRALSMLIFAIQFLPVAIQSQRREQIWKACPDQLKPQLLLLSLRYYLGFRDKEEELRNEFIEVEKKLSRRDFLNMVVTFFNSDLTYKNVIDLFLEPLSKSLIPTISTFSEEELLQALSLIPSHHRKAKFVEQLPTLYPSVIKALLPTATANQSHILKQQLSRIAPTDSIALAYLESLPLSKENICEVHRISALLDPKGKENLIKNFCAKIKKIEEIQLLLQTLAELNSSQLNISFLMITTSLGGVKGNPLTESSFELILLFFLKSLDDDLKIETKILQNFLTVLDLNDLIKLINKVFSRKISFNDELISMIMNLFILKLKLPEMFSVLIHACSRLQDIELGIKIITYSFEVMKKNNFKIQKSLKNVITVCVQSNLLCYASAILKGLLTFDIMEFEFLRQQLLLEQTPCKSTLKQLYEDLGFTFITTS